MFIRDANAIAERLIAEMAPFCLQVEIAGSIRRRCQVVKDIEIVAVAKWEPAPVEEQALDLFGTPPDPPEDLNLLHVWAMTQATRAGVRWIKTGTKEIVDWQPKPRGKYWRALVGTDSDAIKLDLFIAHPDNYGLIKLIRTGAKEFSSGVLYHAKRNTPYQTESSYFEQHKIKGRGEPEAYLVESARWGRRIATTEERDVFDLLSLDYVEPSGRTGFHDLKKEGRTVFADNYRMAGMSARGSR